jgi:hypothetical protein
MHAAMVLMMVGATVYAYFMSNMNVVVASINIANTRKNQHMAAVHRFLKDRQVQEWKRKPKKPNDA